MLRAGFYSVKRTRGEPYPGEDGILISLEMLNTHLYTLGTQVPIFPNQNTCLLAAKLNRGPSAQGGTAVAYP